MKINRKQTEELRQIENPTARALKHFEMRLAHYLKDVVIDEHGCWIYQRRKDCYGYGTATAQGRDYKLHRMVWMLVNGKIIDSNTHVCHRCPNGENSSCLNPRHLHAGTASDNHADRIRHGISNKKLTDEVVIAIKLDLFFGMNPTEIAEKYGVSAGTVYKIRKGDRRSDVAVPKELLGGDLTSLFTGSESSYNPLEQEVSAH